jgi:hypothetical protein
MLCKAAKQGRNVLIRMPNGTSRIPLAPTSCRRASPPLSAHRQNTVKSPIPEMNRICLVLLDTANMTVGPCPAAIDGILVSVMIQLLSGSQGALLVALQREGFGYRVWS